MHNVCVSYFVTVRTLSKRSAHTIQES